MILWFPLALVLGASPLGPAERSAPEAPRFAQSSQHSFSERLARLTASLVPGLIEFADECHALKLYAQRDRVWEQVISIDGDHLRGRKRLRYVRTKDGWTRSKSYRPASDRKVAPEVRRDLSRRYDALVRPHRARVLALVAEHRAAVAARELPERFLITALRHLLTLDPNDRGVHRLLGERRVQGEWILTESHRAASRRLEISGLAQAAHARTEAPEPGQVQGDEPASAVRWHSMLRTKHARVFATVKRSEAETTARDIGATYDFLEALGTGAVPPRPTYTVYLLARRSERDQLLTRYPELADNRREILLRGSGGWFRPSEHVGQWNRDAKRRRDGAVRQTICGVLHDAFGISSDHGWVWEGLGLYLTYQLVGTRHTYFVSAKPYDRDDPGTLWKQLQTTRDWRARALAMHSAGTAPSLHRVLGLTTNGLGDAEMLVAYTLAAYLTEGHPDRWGPLLARLGHGESSTLAFERELGFTLPTLEARLWRFLAETAEVNASDE